MEASALREQLHLVTELLCNLPMLNYHIFHFNCRTQDRNINGLTSIGEPEDFEIDSKKSKKSPKEKKDKKSKKERKKGRKRSRKEMEQERVESYIQ